MTIDAAHVPTIRTATVDDVGALEAIEQRSFPYARMSHANFVRNLRRGKSVLNVAEIGGLVLGYYLLLVPARKRARLYSLAVHEGYRGLGLGSKLITHAEASCCEAGKNSLSLEVLHSNASAFRLYQTLGYSLEVSIDDYYAIGLGAFRLVKRLPC